MKKFFVLFVLFALPLGAYLFFASGVNNFARLPVLTSQIYPLERFDNIEDEMISFNDKISILAFPGKEPGQYLTNAYHLFEKIYEPYYKFKDFQIVFVVPEGGKKEINGLKKELSGMADLKKWRFVVGEEQEVQQLFQSLGSNLELNANLSSPNAFIIDKDGRLRGRQEDEDGKRLYGYNTASIAVINNKMVDDLKVILAEYRLELKKYNKRE